MKKLTFKNSHIVSLFNALEAIEVAVGKARRGKAKLQSKLIEADKEFQENKKEILEEYFELREKGEMIKDEYEQPLAQEGKDAQEGLDKLQELLDEELEVAFVTHESKLKAFYQALDNDEFTVAKGKTLNDMAFDVLMDALDDTFAKTKEEAK